MWHVLIIDDEDDFRLLLKQRLTMEGFVVDEAADGEEALEKIHQRKPDSIILDILMPRMNGYQFWKHLKQEEGLKNIPVLVLSAKLQASDHFWRDLMPKQNYFIKTHPFDLLINRLREIRTMAETSQNPLPTRH